MEVSFVRQRSALLGKGVGQDRLAYVQVEVDSVLPANPAAPSSA